MSSDLYTDHKPIIEKYVSSAGDGFVYKKVELDDNWYHRKTKSISINAKILETVDAVQISIPHRKVTVHASKLSIKQSGTVLTFKGEVKYYLPITKWIVIEGNQDWVDGVYSDLSIPRI